MPVDQRGRDNPPRFTITSNVEGYKYHAVLVETVYIPSRLVLDLRDQGHTKRTKDGDLELGLPWGIYGFQTIEARDKFVRRCNAAADATEHYICFAVTLTDARVANMRQPDTGPVAEDDETTNQGNSND